MRYRCCRHCLVNQEGVCDDATTGHVQTCPETCREGSLPFEPKPVEEAPKPDISTVMRTKQEALRLQIAEAKKTREDNHA